MLVYLFEVLGMKSSTNSNHDPTQSEQIRASYLDRVGAQHATALKDRMSQCSNYVREIHKTKTIVTNVVTSNSQEEHEVLCLMTVLTESRIERLLKLFRVWPGCITLVVHLPKERHDEIQQYITNVQNATHHNRTTVHFVYSDDLELTPINFLRNVALQWTTSEFVFYVDVDLIPSKNLHQQILQSIKSENFQKNLKSALIIPAFAMKEQSSSDFPQSKKELLIKFSRMEAEPFYAKEYAPAYGPTNYRKWVQSSTVYQIRVGCYNEFEPYMVVRNPRRKDVQNETEAVQFYSEAFIHRFINKAIYFTDLCIRHFQFFVEPEGFLLHQPHTSQRSDLRNKIRKFDIKQCAYASYKMHYESEGRRRGYTSSHWTVTKTFY